MLESVANFAKWRPGSDPPPSSPIWYLHVIAPISDTAFFYLGESGFIFVSLKDSDTQMRYVNESDLLGTSADQSFVLTSRWVVGQVGRRWHPVEPGAQG